MPISLQSNDPIIETSQHSSLQYEDYPMIEAESVIKSQKDTLQSENLAILSSRLRKRNRRNTLWGMIVN
jgi:hypothetical protein